MTQLTSNAHQPGVLSPAVWFLPVPSWLWSGATWWCSAALAYLSVRMVLGPALAWNFKDSGCDSRNFPVHRCLFPLARSRVIQLGEYLISALLLFKMSLLAVFCVALPSFSMPRVEDGGCHWSSYIPHGCHHKGFLQNCQDS